METLTAAKARLHAETALQQSEERYRVLVECSPEPGLVHRLGNIIFVNPAAIKMFAAKSAQELIGRSLLELVHPGARHIILARLKSLAAGSTEDSLYELKFVRFDGKTIDVELRGTVITYAGGPAVQCSLRDITAAREAEDALRNSEVALAEAKRVAQIGSWSWHAPTDTSEWSDQLFKIFNLEVSSSTLNWKNQLALFTEESAACLVDAAQKAMQAGEAYDLELELSANDGGRRWVGVRGKVRLCPLSNNCMQAIRTAPCMCLAIRRRLPKS